MTGFLIAESAIRQLYARYTDAVFRKDSASFIDCFAAEAEWKIAGMNLRGHAQIVDQFKKFMATTERVLMFPGTPILDIGDNSASGRTYVTEYVKLANGQAIRTIGIYYDRFVKQQDGWRFLWRHWTLSYYGPPDFSAPFYDAPDYGPPPAMPGADEPTVIRQ
jgi:ketosteroid isomerase-like protein